MLKALGERLLETGCLEGLKVPPTDDVIIQRGKGTFMAERSCTHFLLWVEVYVSPLNSYVEVLTPSTSA